MMSVNYEVPKKKSEQSRYIYKNNELDSQTFIFELILVNKNENQQIVRKIKKSNQDSLITSEDNICYNSIMKYKLTVIDISNPNEPIVVKEMIDHSLSTNTFLNNMIYLEITYDNNENLVISYNIL